MPDLVEALRSFLPEAFPEKDAGQLSGGVLVPGTMANDRAKRKVPRHCYTHDAAGRVIIFRDPFLDEYYRPKLEKRQPIKLQASAGTGLALHLRLRSRRRCWPSTAD